MCRVQDIETCEKKVVIYLQDGRSVASDWFADDERKNAFSKDRFTAKEKAWYDKICEENQIDSEIIDHWTVNRNKDDDNCVYITRHAFDRMRQRNGWNKKTALRMVKKIYDQGLSPSEVRGKYKPYMRKKAAESPEADLKLYGQMIYVFYNNILITTMHVGKTGATNEKCA